MREEDRWREEEMGRRESRREGSDEGRTKGRAEEMSRVNKCEEVKVW